MFKINKYLYKVTSIILMKIPGLFSDTSQWNKGSESGRPTRVLPSKQWGKIFTRKQDSIFIINVHICTIA